MKFRKKPVVIEAIQWDETTDTLTLLKSRGMVDVRHEGHTAPSE